MARKLKAVNLRISRFSDKFLLLLVFLVGVRVLLVDAGQLSEAEALGVGQELVHDENGDDGDEAVNGKGEGHAEGGHQQREDFEDNECCAVPELKGVKN